MERGNSRSRWIRGLGAGLILSSHGNNELSITDVEIEGRLMREQREWGEKRGWDGMGWDEMRWQTTA